MVVVAICSAHLYKGSFTFSGYIIILHNMKGLIAAYVEYFYLMPCIVKFQVISSENAIRL